MGIGSSQGIDFLSYNTTLKTDSNNPSGTRAKNSTFPAFNNLYSLKLNMYRCTRVYTLYIEHKPVTD